MIYLGSDHGGFSLKEKLKVWLLENNIVFEDMGANFFDANDDYPDFIIPVAQKVTSVPTGLGIIIGRSGNGEAICANKVKGIRAAVCLNEEMAKKAKGHNNANILSLGADYISDTEAKRIVKTFINTNFSNEEKHIRRINKINQLENTKIKTCLK